MNTNLTTLVSWSDASAHMKADAQYPLLYIGDKGLEWKKESSFADKMWRKTCALFGVGKYSLQKIVTLVEETLQKADAQTVRSQKLKEAIKLLHQKIDSFEKKDFFGIFPLFRKKINKTLSLPEKAVSVKVKSAVKKPILKRKKSAIIDLTIPEKPRAHPKKRDENVVLPNTEAKPAPVIEQKKITKDASVTKKNVEASLRRGITNEGNTCFAAATLQALQAVTPDFSFEGLRFFCNAVQSSKESSAQTGIGKLLTSLSNEKWAYTLGTENDPNTFYEDGVLPHLKNACRWKLKGLSITIPAIFNQKINVLPQDATSQKILAGMYQKKPLELDGASPDFFALCLDGRTYQREGREQYNQNPVSLDYRVDLASTTGKKEPYQLASVIVYDTHHYYAVEPVYEHATTPAFWNRYNDSFVSKISHTESLEQTLRTKGYMFFYKKA